MTTFADSLKREIARVARKELRDEITALRKSTVAQRGEISLLKKQVQELQSDVRKLTKLLDDKPGQQNREGSVPVSSSAKGKHGRKVLFTAQRLKAERSRLGFTQEQMAVMLGVSPLSVWKWETGGAMPRASRVPYLLERLALGKREARAILNESIA